MPVVTGLDVIYGQEKAPDKGYHKIPVDLNKGAGGEYVFICYSTSEETAGPPITNIQVFASKSKDFEIQEGYEKITKDLNKGAGGLFIYLCYTTSVVFPPITAIYVIQGPNHRTFPATVEWVRINQNCSEGARFRPEYTYVIYKR